MTAKFTRDGLNLTRHLLDFITEVSVKESDAQRAIREATAPLPMARMMISPVQGQVMGLLARLVRPRRVVEVGSFTGYSAAWMVDALEPGGTLVACDLSLEYLELARQNWAAAGIADRIEVRQGPAADSLQALLDEGWGQSVDLIFVDADKTGYARYYELGLELLRPGGLMLFDNVLWSGAVADPSVDDPSTEALRQISRIARDDASVHSALLSVGDGLLAVFKPY